jgi:hypothetical protein
MPASLREIFPLFPDTLPRRLIGGDELFQRWMLDERNHIHGPFDTLPDAWEADASG